MVLAEKKKILVVDDYVPTRNLIIDSLGQLGLYDIGEAADGIEGLRLFREKRHDLVISDIMMPVMSGMELLQAIKEIRPSASVLMITAHPAVELTVSAMKQGAVDFLKKPFDIDELIFKVDLYLREGGDTSEEVSGQSLSVKKEELSLISYIYEAVERDGEASDDVFQNVVDVALKVVAGGSGALFLYDAEADDFYHKVAINNGNSLSWENSLYGLKDLFSRVVSQKDALMVHSERDPLISPSLICAPLMIRERVLGVLCIRKKQGTGFFTKNDLHHVLSLSKRASLNIENKVLYESIFKNLMDTFKSLVASIQVRDHYTEEHSRRVCDMASRIALALNCTESDIASIRVSSLLHDIGKISIPDSVLLKTDRLTPDEYLVIKNHPMIGDDILSSVALLDKERSIIRYHHERWDGEGYPQGLKGEEIPLLARVLAVADSFDAMTSDRPYRKGMSHACALQELRQCCGRQFDGRVLDAFLNVV